MPTVMENISVRERTRLPHEVVSLLCALHRAVARLLDDHAALLPTEEMYAVFDEDSAVSAFAVLALGFAKHARILTLSAEETTRKILLHMTGERRTSDGVLTYRDILPEREACRAVLDSYLSSSRMAYELVEKEGALRLTVALPRFLADSYDVCAIDADNVCSRFYDMLLLSAGDEPKRPISKE